MKTEQGLVIEVIENVAKIRVGRHNDCKNCGACSGNNSIVIEADNKIGAKTGQRVVFKVKENSIVTSAFIVFVLPLISLFLGVFLGEVIGAYIGINIRFSQVIGGLGAAAIAIGAVKKIDKHAAKNNKSKPVIIQILK